MSCTSTQGHRAGVAFDSVAEQYDAIFTNSIVGRAQRDAVWSVLRGMFRAGDRVLELNCGTGEDALFLARMGVSVYACDASERMVAVAARRTADTSRNAQIQLEIRATEDIGGLPTQPAFDGALSNFSGFNCITDLRAVALDLAPLVRPGGRLVLCCSSRLCLWETLWYIAGGHRTRAARRWKGSSNGVMGDIRIEVFYPTVRELQRCFSPMFRLQKVKGIGVSVPPSYVEPWAERHPHVLRRLQFIDSLISEWPVCRSIGDHTLMVFQRTGA